MSTSCPACGSLELRTKTEKVTLPSIYGESVQYDERMDCCSICGECGDFEGENDSRIEEALTKSKKQMVNSMLDDLSKHGIKMTFLERVLGLPSRTVSRWKSGESSAASIALLRTIRLFPWILEVADARFDQNFADMKMLNEANKIWYYKIMHHAKKASMNISVDSENVDFHAHVQIPTSSFKAQIQYLT